MMEASSNSSHRFGGYADMPEISEVEAYQSQDLY